MSCKISRIQWVFIANALKHIKSNMAESASATAIPREINLGLQKPVATPAYTRRFKSQAQNPESTAGTQATITLDTAQPGSFIDTLESYLSFTLRLTNSSTDRGYNVAFSSCGAHALIRAMRIYVQGVPIEEITEYNALAEWLHDLTGIPDYCDRSAKSRYLANTMMGEHYIYVPPAAGGTDGARDIAIQLPLISGVLGTMAEKMFPSMLVAPGNCYIQLDMATAANAFRVMEIDVSSLIVANGGTDNSTVFPQGFLSNFADILPSATTAVSKAVIDNDGTENPITHYGTASNMLEDRPYDVPFSRFNAPTAGTKLGAGVLTTEERIGGGLFAGTTISATNVLRVGQKMTPAVYSAGITDIAIQTSQGAGNSSPAVFFGSGQLAGNATMTSAAQKKVNTSVTPTIQYTIRNLEYIGKQVVVGDDVARAIIERAAAGDISIHTQSYRQYPSTIPCQSGWAYRLDPAYASTLGTSAVTAGEGKPLVNMYQRFNVIGGQSIIIPAKISSANAIYHIFRNGAGLEDYQYDSLRRITIGFSDGPGSGTTGINAQLRIGNELIPQSPIQSASEALEELLKAHHMDGFYGTCEKMGSIVASSSQLEWPRPNGLQIRRGAVGNEAVSSSGLIIPTIPREMDIVRSGTAATTYGGELYLRNDFNSQLLCPNPDSVTFKFPTFAGYCNNGATPTAEGGPNDGISFFKALGYADTATRVAAAAAFYDPTSSSTQYHVLQKAAAATGDVTTTYYEESVLEYGDRQAKFRKAVRKAFFGYADERSDHQVKNPSKDNYLNPYRQHTGRYSTFMLGFDLDTFSNNSDTIRSGHYLGNNTVSLNLSSVEFIDNSPCNQALMTNARMDTYVLHDLRLSFQAGGIVQAFY
jgi:hypothetical protein